MEPNSIVPAVLQATTQTLLRKYLPMFALVQARPKFSQRSSPGSVHGLLKISVVFLNDARNTHRIGTITRIAQMTSASWPRPLNMFACDRADRLLARAGFVRTGAVFSMLVVIVRSSSVL